MKPEAFIKIRCSICGTQACYGTKEDLSNCNTWNKVKDFPDEMAKIVIDYYDNKPKTHLDLINDLKNLI